MKIENLSISINNKKILSKINLNIDNGSIFALLGVNGAGKTTLMKVMLGLIKPDAGKILYEDNCKPQIGFVIEVPTFYDYLTGFNNLKYYGRLLKCSDFQVEKTLYEVGLDKDKKLVKDYSVGMKQRLAIARAMLGQPDILVLDEPINGLDPKGIYDMRNLFLDLNKKKNITIILSSHLIQETESITTDYAILSNGMIASQFLKKDICEVTKTIDVIPKRKEDVVEIIKSVKDIFPEVLYLIRNGHIKFFTKAKDDNLLIKIKSFLTVNTDLLLEEADIGNGELEEFFIAVTA